MKFENAEQAAQVASESIIRVVEAPSKGAPFYEQWKYAKNNESSQLALTEAQALLEDAIKERDRKNEA
jgi:hypothetical protein